MAKRPQRLDQSLGRLRALEQDTSVVASPVNTYSAPAPVVESTRAREIESAFARLSPVIAGYVADRNEKKREEELKEGIVRYRNATPEQREQDMQLVRNGDPRQAEYWMEGYARSYLEDQANQMATEFGKAYALQSESPDFDYDSFADNYVRQYTAEKGLGVFDEDLLAENFYGRIDGIVAQRRQNYNEQQIAKVKADRDRLYMKDIDRAVSGAIGPDGTVSVGMMSDSLGALIEYQIDLGNDPKETIDNTVDHLTAIATNMAANGEDDWQSILGAMYNIPNRTGVYGETGAGRLYIEKLRQTLQAEEDSSIADDLKETKAAEEIEARNIERTIIDAIAADPSVEVDFADRRSQRRIEYNGQQVTLQDLGVRLRKLDRIKYDNLYTYGTQFSDLNVKTDQRTLQGAYDLINEGADPRVIEQYINEHDDKISVKDLATVRKDAKDAPLLKELWETTGMVKPQTHIKELYKNPFSSGYDPIMNEKLEEYTNEYNLGFRAWRGQNDISTPEGQAAFVEWHRGKLEDIRQRAKPKPPPAEVEPFWKELDKQDLYSMYTYAEEAKRSKRPIEDTDLAKNMLRYIEEVEAATGERLSVRRVHRLIELELGIQ